MTVNSDFRLVCHGVFMLFFSDVAGSYSYSITVYLTGLENLGFLKKKFRFLAF